MAYPRPRFLCLFKHKSGRQARHAAFLLIMPKEFERCVRLGGKVRTISGANKMFGLKKDEYMHICILDGKVYRGEKKKKKKSNK